jgi:hypothetical protein
MYGVGWWKIVALISSPCVGSDELEMYPHYPQMNILLLAKFLTSQKDGVPSYYNMKCALE